MKTRMGEDHKESDPPKLLKSDTRQWSSGRVKLAVIGWEDKPEENYIVLEKLFFGKNTPPNQKFILRSRDWINLKKLIDGDLQPYSTWEKTIPAITENALAELITQSPDSLEKILDNLNILKLSEASLESLDRIAIKLYEVKTERIDLIFKELSHASGQTLTTFSELLEDLRLNQISTMASLVYQKLKVIDLLERTCMDPGKLERDVHDIFDKNPWLMGRHYEIVQSDKPLSQYLTDFVKDDPDAKKRPDLILKTIPYTQDVILVELKAPGVKLSAKHIGQVLEYKALIQNFKPNVKDIHCFVFGYEKSPLFSTSKDADIRTFSELISELRAEYQEYSRIIESGREIQSPTAH